MEKILSPSKFADHVGVHPSRITALKPKLNKQIHGGKWFVVVDEMNLSLFANPHVNRKKR